MTIFQAIYAYTLVLLTCKTFNATTTILTPITSIKMAISKTDHLRLEKSLEQINRLFLATQSSELPLFIELRQQILRYNKRYKKCSELEGWEFPVHAIKVLNIGKSLAASHSEEEIDVSNFTAAVLQWRSDMETFFEQSTISYGKVRIKVANFATKLSRYQSPLPLVSLLYKEWQGVLSKQGEELLGEELFGVLQTHQGAVWEITSDLGALEAHYKKYKRAYKKHASTLKDFKEEAMPKAKYFLDALLVSSSKEDPNLPVNKIKAQEKEEKQQQEAAAELQRWEQDYKNWLNANIDELSNIDSTEEGKVINKHLLSSLRRSELIAPAYAQAFWESTGAAIEAAIVGEEGAVSYKKATKISIDILYTQYKKYVTAEFLQAAVDSRREAMMPIGLEDWLRACVDNNELLYDKFLSKWQAWCESSSNIVALCEHNMKGKTYTIDQKKLSKAMTKAFSYTVNGTSPGVDIWEQIKKHLPLEPTTSFEQLHQAWQNGVEQLGVATFTRNLWNQHLTSGQANENLEQAIAAFFSKAPSQEVLVNALWDARYQAVKAKMPVPKDSLKAFFKITDGAVKHYSFALPLPLTIKAKEMPNGTTQHYAVPNVTGLSIGDLINQGGNSYKIDALHAVKSTTTKIEVAGHILKAWTMVSFKLTVTDSMEWTTVELGKEGSLDIINLNIDQIVGLKKKTGVDLFDGKTVEIGLRLVGDQQGHLGEVQATGTVLGFAVSFHMGKEGWYIKTKSPLAFKEALKQATEGSTNYDIFFSVKVYSEHTGAFHYVYAQNGQQGEIDLEGRGAIYLKRREQLNVIHSQDKIMVPLAK